MNTFWICIIVYCLLGFMVARWDHQNNSKITKYTELLLVIIMWPIGVISELYARGIIKKWHLNRANILRFLLDKGNGE